MMSRRALLIAGILLIVGSSLVLSYPQSGTDEDEMMADDDFEYEQDDQGTSSQQAKTGQIPAKTDSAQPNRTVTVTGIRGEDVVLKCDLDITQSILWFFGKNIIANGGTLVQPNFKLDTANYDLTILKASPQDAGDYYCKALPQGSVLNTKVVIAEHSLDAIAPESSTSASSSLPSLPASLLWPVLTGVCLLKFGRR
ncbi:GL16927 [Drosophila persimilis]|uniref:GL16927 n=1 Tax=Drosophila persimilis TaxID=7234 RepID=B4GHK0_DROPE|nr:uncharacterized protein LOC6592632 [Drosophila persimilis]EDW35970.1 GL16927 [Drosophila persimilis]